MSLEDEKGRGRKISIDATSLSTIKDVVLTSALKGHRFDSFDELSLALRRVLSGLHSKWYKDMVDQWMARHDNCITCIGDYLEKKTDVRIGLSNTTSYDVNMCLVMLPACPLQTVC